MAIEIVPKPKIEKATWANVLLAISIVLLLALAISYFYFYRSSGKLSQDIQEKEKVLEKTPSEKVLEEKLLLTEEKINNFGQLLSSHQKPLNIFNFLEEACHPDVWFSNFNFDTMKREATISGQAGSFIALGQQLLILKELENLKDINLSKISLGEEGEVDFALQLIFESQILK